MTLLLMFVLDAVVHRPQTAQRWRIQSLRNNRSRIALRVARVPLA
jgi:hypothetical protein